MLLLWVRLMINSFTPVAEDKDGSSHLRHLRACPLFGFAALSDEEPLAKYPWKYLGFMDNDFFSGSLTWLIPG